METRRGWTLAKYSNQAMSTGFSSFNKDNPTTGISLREVTENWGKSKNIEKTPLSQCPGDMISVHDFFST